MRQTTKQPIQAITRTERNHLIGQVLAPAMHRGHLHLPKQEYFDGLPGLNKFAQDVVDWLALKDISVQVVEHAAQQWTVSQDNDMSTATVALPRGITADQPFVALYLTTLAICTLAVHIRLESKPLAREAEQQLTEHLIIPAGLGVYRLNAMHEAPHHSTNVGNIIPQQHFLKLFQRYCGEHAIPLLSYEQHLLPGAQQALQTHSPKNARKPFISQFLHRQKRRRHRRWRLALGFLIMLVAIGFLWQYVPQPLNQQQRSMQTDIKVLRQEYETCQNRLTDMKAIGTEPDILRMRSLQLQHRQCEELKHAHNQLVDGFNRSL